jgi:hypothetical protein
MPSRSSGGRRGRGGGGPQGRGNRGGRGGRGGGGPQGRGNRGGRGGRGGADSRGRGGTDSHGRGGTDSRGHGGTDSRGRGGTPPIDRLGTGVHEEICADFWHNGACDRSFDCRFMHKVKPTMSLVSATETEDQSPDFFSREGLAMHNGSKVDSQHTLRPNEAHNHLKRYLADNFVFRDANNVEGFSRIFASVNSRNKGWVRVTLIRL